MRTTGERNTVNLAKPSVDLRESIGPLDFKVVLKLKRSGYHFDTVRLVKALEIFRAEVIASVENANVENGDG